MQQRLPRFHRASCVPAMQLEDRDCTIITFVHRHRFLRSDQIGMLVGGSHQQILRRLKLLFHHGYLERPLAQIDSYHRAGSRCIAYGLGRKGERLLNSMLGINAKRQVWSEKNRAAGRLFIEHTLLVSEIMVAVELSCRRHGIRLLYGNELPLRIRPPFLWHVRIQGGKTLGVAPDCIFALEYMMEGHVRRNYFFLEADRGTMPVIRTDPVQTSFLRKLLAYEGTWVNDYHVHRLGIPQFRVITVTKSPKRVESLIAACGKLKRGRGLFLFADTSILKSDLLTARFQVGREGEGAALL